MNTLEQLEREARYLHNAIGYFKIGLCSSRWIDSILEDIRLLENKLELQERFHLTNQINRDRIIYNEMVRGKEPYIQIKNRVLGHAA